MNLNLLESRRHVVCRVDAVDAAAGGVFWQFRDIPGTGVKSKGKALIKVVDVSFKYPRNDKVTIEKATVQVSLSSRVACIGPNGAGKSTLIKCLTGEVQPTTGTVWQHPNARIGYIAQHAFHHIEQRVSRVPSFSRPSTHTTFMTLRRDLISSLRLLDGVEVDGGLS